MRYLATAFGVLLGLGQTNAEGSQDTQTPPVLFINMERSAPRRNFMESWLGESLDQWTVVNALDASRLLPILNCKDVAPHPQQGEGYCQDKEGLTAKAWTASANGQCLSVKLWMFGTHSRASTLGSGLSHAKAIAVAYAQGLKEALILEDDVRMVDLVEGKENARAVWKYLRATLDSLPKNWEVLQAGVCKLPPAAMKAIPTTVMKNRIQWSHRDHCSGTDFSIWGVQAYVVSRLGMFNYLRRHFPSLLYASVEEAEAFCGTFDLRLTSTCILGDVMIYSTKGAYKTHIPLFVADEEEGSQSTVWVDEEADQIIARENSGHILSRQQDDVLMRAVSSLREDGIFRVDGGGWELEAAIRLTQLRNEEARSSTAKNSNNEVRIMLIPELAADINHMRNDNISQSLGVGLVDVSTDFHRAAFLKSLESKVNIAHIQMWRTLLDSYFFSCSATRSTTPIAGEELHILIPIDYYLRAFIVPRYPAGGVAEWRVYIEKFCCGMREESCSKECFEGMLKWVELAAR